MATNEKICPFCGSVIHEYEDMCPACEIRIVNEILAGKWGNGQERKHRLEVAGYNYRYVQDRVNERLGIHRKNKEGSMSYMSAKEIAQALERAEKEMGGNPVREACEKIYHENAPLIDHGELDVAAKLAHEIEHAVLKDSGERREFESGAVRDIQRGKGRCDLLPLTIVGMLFDNEIFGYINNFQRSNDFSNLEKALDILAVDMFGNRYTMLLEVAIHFEDGAIKYGERNWEKGIPVNCYIDSAVRHYLKYLRGDTDERHDRATCWNLMCAMWTALFMPELNPYGKNEH